MFLLAVLYSNIKIVTFIDNIAMLNFLIKCGVKSYI